jgi:hypothetical protein
MIPIPRPAAVVTIVPSLAIALSLWCAPSAGAQSLADTRTTSATVAPQPQPGTAPPASPSTDPFWELIGGYEGDTHGSSYAFFGPGYVHPIRPGLAWTGRAFANYLAYEFTDGSGTTEVSSPGVSAAAGLRFGDKNFVSVYAGPELKWRRTEVVQSNGSSVSDSSTDLGANVGGEVYANPTSHNNIHGIVNYGTADEYTWARLGFKEQISNRNWQGANTTFLGIEGIAQGNDDIRSTQVGGFFEITRVPAQTSIMFRAGYKRSTFEAGPDKTGPYFAVGFYRRLN